MSPPRPLAGLKVLLLEEGALRTSDSFRDMDEARAYRELYQEAAARATSDGAIAVLQGRTVGGTTTVNWTSSFRTPAPTLRPSGPAPSASAGRMAASRRPTG